jgi:hypothetical protein
VNEVSNLIFGSLVCFHVKFSSDCKQHVFNFFTAEPNFTIPLVDKHLDNKGELTWTCEAFGIPDVNYTWLRNGEFLEVNRLPPEDRDRYIIVDNVLTIKYLDPERDQAMYQCRARNVLKTKYSSAQLRILCK